MGQVADFSQVDALAVSLRKAAVAVQPAVSREVIAAAHEVRDAARNLAPARRRGRLRKSIEATGPRGGPLIPGMLNADIGPTVFYGHMVEGGTVDQAPRPFMGPAIDKVEPLLAARLGVVGVEVIRW